jgi:DNA topoisomerase-1
MNLIIVESPTKARTLSRFLGSDYVVQATMGHIKDLPKSKLGVDVEKNFTPDYVVVEKRDKEIKSLSKEAKKVKIIYLATDPDREGEAIAKHVEEILGKNLKLSRIIFHEITKGAVEDAILKPRNIDNNLVNAQVARRVLDRLVGYKLSPLLWKKVRRGLSAGRVQSVAVRLIVEREREIQAFKPDEYWEVFCDLKTKDEKTKNGEFTVKLVRIGEKKAEISNKKDADSVVSDLKGSVYDVHDVKRKEVRKNPYPPFTTSTMTQGASRMFGWSARKTMSVAQVLYEEGLITYHRTDSTNIAEAALTKVRKHIKEEYGDNYLPEKPRLYKTKSKVAQEAHEAIRPTNMNSKIEIQNSKFKKESEKLYGLIWRKFVSCQMEASVYDETAIEVQALKDNKRYLLRVSGQIMKFDGWRKVFDSSKKTKTQDGEAQLPEVDKGDGLQLIKVLPEQKFTQPPARYGEASLIKTLEKLGIGRPSTYAPIITTIQRRQYVEKEEKKFFPTNVGFAVNDFLINNFPTVFDYSFTAEMEGNLDNIANGKREWEKMMKEFYGPFEKKLGTVETKAKRVEIATEKVGRKCPDCKKGELVIRVGRFGKFISCSRFPDCDYKERYVEKIGMKCLDCKKGDIIVKTTGKGRKFYGCSRYPKCKWASWKKPVSEVKKEKQV